MKQKNNIRSKLLCIRDLILEFLSFNSSRAIVFNLSTIIIILFFSSVSFIEKIGIGCLLKRFIIPLFYGGVCPTSGFFAGCECPACGITRGITALLHGDFGSAYLFNPLSYVVLIGMIIMIGIHLFKILNDIKKK